MDPTTSVRTDALPAIATVFVPGALVVAPGAFDLLTHHPSIASLFAHSELVSGVFAVVACVAAGELVETIGSYVEYYAIDPRHPDRELMLDNWQKYLALAWKIEPIGQRYLRRILVEFKFELNLFVAAAVVLVELQWLRWESLILFTDYWKTCGLLLAAMAGLFLAAWDSSLLLADLRELLINTTSNTSDDSRPDASPP